MFAFFIALAFQALLEREIRSNMSAEQIEKLYIYPEDRECKRPTTLKMSHNDYWLANELN
jgi:hypothetical protein